MYVKLADAFSCISGAGLSAAFSRGNRSQLDRKVSRVEVIYIHKKLYTSVAFTKGTYPSQSSGSSINTTSSATLTVANPRQSRQNQISILSESGRERHLTFGIIRDLETMHAAPRYIGSRVNGRRYSFKV